MLCCDVTGCVRISVRVSSCCLVVVVGGLNHVTSQYISDLEAGPETVTTETTETSASVSTPHSALQCGTQDTSTTTSTIFIPSYFNLQNSSIMALKTLVGNSK